MLSSKKVTVLSILRRRLKVILDITECNKMLVENRLTGSFTQFKRKIVITTRTPIVSRFLELNIADWGLRFQKLCKSQKKSWLAGPGQGGQYVATQG